VRVIVAALRAQPLVSRQQHRNALAQQEQRDEVTSAPRAEALDRGIVARTLDARVPAEVVIAAVAVVLAVRLVVLTVIADEVVEREAVVARDEVDAVRRPTAVPAVEVAAARDPGRDVTEHAGIAAQETAHRVSIHAVPFEPPKAREVADLIEPAGIPRLGDQLCA